MDMTGPRLPAWDRDPSFITETKQVEGHFFNFRSVDPTGRGQRAGGPIIQTTFSHILIAEEGITHENLKNYQFRS